MNYLKYFILMILTTSCHATTYSITTHELELVCQNAYLQAVLDYKKYLPHKVRTELIHKNKYVDACILMIHQMEQDNNK